MSNPLLRGGQGRRTRDVKLYAVAIAWLTFIGLSGWLFVLWEVAG